MEYLFSSYLPLYLVALGIGIVSLLIGEVFSYFFDLDIDIDTAIEHSCRPIL